MEVVAKTQKRQLYLWLYVVLFFVLWSLREIVVIQYIDRYTTSWFETLAKFLVWILPVYLYLKYLDRVNPFLYLKLNTPASKSILWGISLGFLYYLGYMMFYQVFSFNPNTTLNDWLEGFIMVGLTEEIVFRGFLLPKLSDYWGFAKANIIQSALFVLIHVPVWIAQAPKYFTNPSLGEVVFAVGFIFIFGLAMGLFVKKANSLWGPIVFHSIVDLATITLIS